MVEKHERGQDFQFLESNEIEKTKPYVFKNFDHKKEDNFQVLHSHKCPTIPPTYIHVDYEKKNEPTVYVIFKDILPPPTFTKIQNYQMKLVDEIKEGKLDLYVDFIKSTHKIGIKKYKFISISLLASTKDLSAEKQIIHSLYDTDELPEERRMQMCRRASLIIPEVNIQILERTSTGKNKYYAIKYKANRGTEEIENWRTVTIQAFDCQTEPKTYINVVGNEEQNVHCMWAIVKQNGHIMQPILGNITGYYIVQVKSIELYQDKGK